MRSGPLLKDSPSRGKITYSIPPEGNTEKAAAHYCSRKRLDANIQTINAANYKVTLNRVNCNQTPNKTAPPKGKMGTARCQFSLTVRGKQKRRHERV